jgi:NAD(P)-dependent dehydrogenase (short-subunit alcohol dehydrogenase family)
MKTILITGCSTGIGFDAMKTLHEKGFQVYATARNDDDLNRIRMLGIEAVYMEMTDHDSIKTALDSVLSKTGGRLDILFNNAAYGQPGAVEDLPVEVLRKQFEVNVFSWHYLTTLVVKVMREQGAGKLIFNSSVLGFVCMPYRGAYNASKYALEGLVDTLRLELSQTNIQVSLIEPGPIETHFRKNALKAFKESINYTQSNHTIAYQRQIDRLEKEGPSATFTLPASSVTKVLLKAINAKKTKPRYRVTFPTKLFAVLKRLLPTTWLDALLIKG